MSTATLIHIFQCVFLFVALGYTPKIIASIVHKMDIKNMTVYLWAGSITFFVMITFIV